jgi:hypothetical protein
MYLERADYGAAEGDRADLQGAWSLADFNGDIQAKREIQNRRAEIDRQLGEHEEDVRGLRTSLDGLPAFKLEAAHIAAEIDSLDFGIGYAFARELQDALLRNQSDLNNRVHEAKRILPKYSQKVYEDVRRNNYEEYRRRQESKEAEQVRQARMQKERKERSTLTKSAVTDEDGYLRGFNIKDQSGRVIGFEKIMRVPITQ